MTARSELSAVSLFSNIGAGDVGYAKAGFRFDVMAELEPKRMEVCLLNHPAAVGVIGDLRKTWPQVVDGYRSKFSSARPALLAACPPCQGLSSARSKRGSIDDPDAGMRDSRNLLVTVIAKVAKELKPRMIVVENVTAFLTRQVRHPKTGLPVTAANLLCESLTGYTVFPLVADLSQFGVPQSRKRCFLTFICKNEPGLKHLETIKKVPYPAPSHGPLQRRPLVTLRNALAAMNLPRLDAASEESAASSEFGGLHTVPVWDSSRYSMVAAIPPNSGKGAWTNDQCEKCGRVRVGESDAACPKCRGPLLRPVVDLGRGRYRLITGFRCTTYTRMRPHVPAATITTASANVGSNNTIHPFENRVLSALECALLQTIPRSFRWGGAVKRWGIHPVRQMIGEAVPPMFTKLHGKVLCQVLNGQPVKNAARHDSIEVIRASKRLKT